ncbi:unnamed protein product, partial [Symbiodinium microadriaticum]
DGQVLRVVRGPGADSTVRDILEPQYGEALLRSMAYDQLSPLVGDQQLDPSTDLLERQWSKIIDPAYVLKGDRFGRLKGAARSREIDVDGKAPTLTSGYRNPHNITTRFVFEEKNGLRRERPRFLSRRECCRLMGFNDKFVIPTGLPAIDGTSQQVNLFYKQIGNAVCPPIVKALGERMLEAMGMDRPT